MSRYLSFRLFSTQRQNILSPRELYPAITNDPKMNIKSPQFDAIIDVRSPSEFNDGHLPGAISVPALSDQEKAKVGKTYDKEKFSGRYLGARLMLTNLAKHFSPTGVLADISEDYCPLVYCRHGRQRSRGTATILSEIMNKPVMTLEGGYHGFRDMMVEDTDILVRNKQIRIISGLTGSGKTFLLESLKKRGYPVINLEELARHKGSLFGAYSHRDEGPNCGQPTQKMFETQLWGELRQLSFKGHQELWIECESRAIGRRSIPESLWVAMKEAPRVVLHVPIEQRVRHIIKEYQHLLEDVDYLIEMIDCLKQHHPENRISHWKSLLVNKDYSGLVENLLRHHYDPMYSKSKRNYLTSEDESKVIHLPIPLLDDHWMALERLPSLVRMIDKKWSYDDQELEHLLRSQAVEN